MPASEASHAQKTKFSFDILSETAENLNTVSNHLNEAIERLNAALKRLNLGVQCWVRTWSFENDHVSDVEELGYARVRGKWGICIRKTIAFDDGSDDDETEWHFQDAPRDLRIRAMAHLDELIEALNKEANRAAQVIKERAFKAAELADTLTVIAEKTRPARKGEK